MKARTRAELEQARKDRESRHIAEAVRAVLLEIADALDIQRYSEPSGHYRQEAG